MRLNFKFLQTDGVPLTADLMDVMQQAYAIFNVIGDIAGNLTILSGCEIDGTLVAPGIVVINGDVLYFEGGTLSENVFIYQENIAKVFRNQQSKILIEKKTVKFGNASEVYPWADFVRIDTLRQISENLANKVDQDDFDLLEERLQMVELKTAPIVNGGVVFIFNKEAADIPDGWKECLDLRGKTVFGYDPNDPTFANFGAPGGNKEIYQSIAQMPKHAHSFSTGLENVGSGNQNGLSKNGSAGFTKSTTEVGGNEAMNILNPHKIVLFIEPNFQ